MTEADWDLVPFFKLYFSGLKKGLGKLGAYSYAIRRLDGMCYHPGCPKIVDWPDREFSCEICGMIMHYRVENSIRKFVCVSKPRCIL